MVSDGFAVSHINYTTADPTNIAGGIGEID